jgi:hypothetical protein
MFLGTIELAAFRGLVLLETINVSMLRDVA